MKIKRWIAGLVLTFGVVVSAHALLPLAAAVVWLGGVVTANASLATALEASIVVHTAAIVAYDLFFAQKDSSGKPTGTPPLTVKLNPSAARSNPDPAKFDDPASGARDVTPKSTTTGSQTSVNTPAGLAPPQTIYCANNVCGPTPQAVCAGQPTTRGNYNNQPGTFYHEFQSDGHCHLRYKFDSLSTVPDFGPDTDAVKSTTNTTACPGIGLTASAGKCPASNFPETGPVTCPTGYTAGSGTSCVLSDAGAVKKPETQPCEILRTASGFQSDSANPNCAQEGIQVQGNSLQMDGQSVSVNADGSVSVSTPTGQTTFQIGSYNTDGSVNITGVSRTGNPGAYVPGNGSGGGTGGGSGGGSTSPTCGGVGQPACSSGDGKGGSDCGAPGQPACAIDDSGFAGKTISTAEGEAALDAYNTQRSDLLDTIKNGVNAPNFGWQLPVQSIACQPLEFGFFKGMHFRLNWCQYIDLIHQAISFLAYCFTALYLFGLFYGGDRQGGK